MAGPVVPVAAWMAKVSQRNAPGAINAIALLVSPVSPSVLFISPVDVSAMCSPKWVNISSGSRRVEEVVNAFVIQSMQS
jgi:hypothetical protein